MAIFRVGDKVYAPSCSNKVYVLTETNGRKYSLRACRSDAGTDAGCRAFSHGNMPKLFHATDENCELLSKLYGIEFEKPGPSPLTSFEIVRHLLITGKQKFVPCYVSDSEENPTNATANTDTVCIMHCDRDSDDEPVFFSFLGGWNYATPFDVVTGEPITKIDGDDNA
ncbi:hypothetical protein ACFBZI_11795 [Moraxella sp. ZJ142]|uniref:hypothetical protein n=1 Tax=Moraxella marmotae TaxID=3344520 RepID=UPI0035D4C18C